MWVEFCRFYVCLGALFIINYTKLSWFEEAIAYIREYKNRNCVKGNEKGLSGGVTQEELIMQESTMVTTSETILTMHCLSELLQLSHTLSPSSAKIETIHFLY